MMNSAWNLTGDADTYKKYGKGWSGDEPANPMCYSFDNKKESTGAPTQYSGMMSCNNPFGNMTDLYKGQATQKRNRNSLANDSVALPNNKSGHMVMTG